MPLRVALPNRTAIGADAVNLGLDTEVAVTVMDSCGGDNGAVYKPVELTVPQLAATVQPVTLHVTAVLLSVEVTVGVNCWVPPAGTLALRGEIEIVTVGAVSVTVALPTLVVSACEVAVMTCVMLAGKIVGAVYRPVVLIVPMFALPPCVPLTAHVTAVLVEPVTVAVNCCVVPPARLAVVGEMVTETVVVGLDFPPPHPAQINAIDSTSGKKRFIKSPLRLKSILSESSGFLGVGNAANTLDRMRLQNL